MTTYAITLKYDDESAQLSIEGLPGNRLLAYGILELAKDAIQEQYLKKNQSMIVGASGPIPPFKT